MADRKLEEVLWAEYKRVTRGQQVERSNKLPVLLNQSTMKTKTAASPSQGQKFSTSAKAPTSAAVNKAYTEPAPPRSPAKQTSGSSTATAKSGNAALDVVKSRLETMPLISTLVNLFSRGGTPAAPPPLVRYAMPRSIHIEAANSRQGGSFQSADHGQSGTVRAYSDTAAANPESGRGAAPMWPAAGGANATAAQIPVNMQAVDSRWFLDHSQEIAQAVREAMLNMHALNDVVSEL